MDHLSPLKRSWNMSKIKSKHTIPEITVRKLLTQLGFKYRLHITKLPGKPDIVLKKYNSVIFVNGCFWHQHPNCKRATVPKTRPEYWISKLNKNVENQENNIKKLKSDGWKVLVIWECQTLHIDEITCIINNEITNDRPKENSKKI